MLAPEQEFRIFLIECSDLLKCSDYAQIYNQ